MGFSMATQEVSYIRQLQLEMRGDEGVPYPVKVYVDSQLALALIHNLVFHPRTKQILSTTSCETGC